MCGILGLVRKAGLPVRLDALRNGLTALEHRGPDDTGLLLFDGGSKTQQILGIEAVAHDRSLLEPVGALGSCRLSILDPSPAARQPMYSPDGRTFMVFNGEIMNYVELRQELVSTGHQFRSTGDTEVLLAAFQHWGVGCLKRLVGMFAFAILDLSRRQLVLARDFFGIKPLYYATKPAFEGFAFSSQVASLLEFAPIDRRPNAARLQEFLTTGWVDHGGESLFEGVQQLAPAHYLKLDIDSLETDGPVRYWGLPMGKTADLTFSQAVEQFRELFLDSVRMHLRSDAPLAAALSGGLDSSSIVTAMRHVQAPDTPIHTFTFIASSGGKSLAWSEEPWADRAGQNVRATMHKVHAEPHRLPEEFDRFLFLQDAPCWSPVVWAQQQIFRAAHEKGFKVMLSGQGSDEILAGYDRHIASRIASLIQQGRLPSAIGLLNQASRLPQVARTALLRNSLIQAIPPGVKAWVRHVRPSTQPLWLHQEWFAERDGTATSLPYEAGKILRSVLRKDVLVSPLPALLRYEDRNSMTYSIDNRLPFLTPQIAEFILTLPEEYLVASNAVCKSLLREAMRGLLPEETIQRKDKQGFPVPVSEWLFELRAWAEDMLRQAEDVALLNGGEIKRVRERFFSSGGESVMDAFLLWRWIFLAGWIRRFDISLD